MSLKKKAISAYQQSDAAKNVERRFEAVRYKIRRVLGEEYETVDIDITPLDASRFGFRIDRLIFQARLDTSYASELGSAIRTEVINSVELSVYDPSGGGAKRFETLAELGEILMGYK